MTCVIVKQSNDELFIAWRLHMCTTIVQQWQLIYLKSNDYCDENNVNLNAHMNGFGFLKKNWVEFWSL